MRRVTLLIGLLLSGCQREAQEGARGALDEGERQRGIALIDPIDQAPVDALIRSLQASARRDPEKVDYWVGLGQAWVRKARERSDPSFYLNASASADVALKHAPGITPALDLRALVLL